MTTPQAGLFAWFALMAITGASAQTHPTANPGQIRGKITWANELLASGGKPEDALLAGSHEWLPDQAWLTREIMRRRAFTISAWIVDAQGQSRQVGCSQYEDLAPESAKTDGFSYCITGLPLSTPVTVRVEVPEQWQPDTHLAIRYYAFTATGWTGIATLPPSAPAFAQADFTLQATSFDP